MLDVYDMLLVCGKFVVLLLKFVFNIVRYWLLIFVLNWMIEVCVECLNMVIGFVIGGSVRLE